MAATIRSIESKHLVEIPADADFPYAVRLASGTFPVGSYLELRIRDSSGNQLAAWAGIRDAGDPRYMRWNVDEDDVAAMLAEGTPRKIRVHYLDGAQVNLLWAIWQAKVA